ncbi:MAG: hypothetical protein GTO45_18185 [Candidatus Aminicenantes bacterium]|nr:hypothetical protein [Candidatus Aminicenantes bacterium]NIM80717.1 hypothetical protein [Candidatus Aminicenantes bacterium]NIN20092.1 hypothetical protein [Candidatus Aminicenantes bacterium]NIN43879.1 hypothetical protein [Candidatus Aminicenantes bacterium]NIN86688.1 hypothetical protein [Candidatus Aminicenantes bacterium]
MGKYALIIGIENYPSDSGQEKVKYAKNDAAEMAHYARSAGFQLIGDGPIMDEKAAYSQIIEWLDLMFHYVQPDDFVLLYYAGHGYYSEYGGYLIPYDYNSNNEKNESTCISFDSINKRLKNKKPAKFVFFLDTCHSGFAGEQIDIRSRNSLKYKKAGIKARRKVKTQINNMVRGVKSGYSTGRVVFTSSSPHEPSIGIDEFKHGLFTYYLLQNLKPKSLEPEINIEELIILTKNRVISYSIKNRLRQTPTAYTNIQGEFYIPTYTPPPDSELSTYGEIVKETLIQRLKHVLYNRLDRFKSLATILLVVLGIVITLLLSPLIQKTGSQFGPIEGVKINDNILAAIDVRGNQWVKNFHSKINRHVVADIDKDGEKDVLVGFSVDGDEGGRVIAFNTNGKEKWRFFYNSPYPYYGSLRGKLAVTDLRVFDENQERIITVLLKDFHWYQSVFVVLNPGGEKLKEFWHPGHMHQIEKVKDTYIIRAVNNDLRQTALSKNPRKNFSVIFGLRFENIYGQAPPYFGISRKNINFEWYYVLSDQDESFTQMVPFEDKISISISCGLVFYLNDAGTVLRRGLTDGYSCDDSLNLIPLNLLKR